MRLFFLEHPTIKLQAKIIELNFLLKFSDLKSNFTLTLGYFNPALNNPGQDDINSWQQNTLNEGSSESSTWAPFLGIIHCWWSIKKNKEGSFGKRIEKKVFQQPSAFVIDAMALVQRLKGDHEMFAEVANVQLGAARRV